MFKNFLLISLRGLSRQKGFSFINIFGLSLAFTVGFMIVLYVSSELSFDKFHKDYKRTFRVCVEGKLSGAPLNLAISPAGLGRELKKSYPEIEAFSVFEYVANKQLLSSVEKSFYDSHILYADTGFFELFSFKMLHGEPSEALRSPYTVVLTESISKKYFGDSIPIGKTMKLNNQTNLTVTGIIEDPPEQTHLAFNLIISLETLLAHRGPSIYNNWGNMMYYTYVKLSEGNSPEDFNLKIADLINNKIRETDGEEQNISVKPYLQPIKDIHLRSGLVGEIKPNGNILYIFILPIIAFLILIIAGVNYVNLSMARKSNRIKEVSVRKILGSEKNLLIMQFIGESVFFSLISLIIAVAFIELMLPVFNEITSKSINLNYVESFRMLMSFTAIAILFGISSGSYPAIVLSSFRPGDILRSKIKTRPGKKGLRNSLVLVQFSISAVLIISTVVVYHQLDFMRSKNIGFDKENLITIFLRNEEVRNGAEQLKRAMLEIPGVQAATLAASIPGTSLSGSTLYPEEHREKPLMIYNFDVDKDFIENTFRMKIIQGRNFSADTDSDNYAIIINNKLKTTMGWENAIGKTFSANPEDTAQAVLNVIGVVNDFNFRSLHQKIETMAILFKKEIPGFLVLRVDSSGNNKTISMISETWENFNPEFPFDYEYLSDSFDKLYTPEKRLGLLFIYLTVFAIFIASMGLLGLAAHSAEQRTKEIGIRKALGASVMDISKMLSTEYLKLLVYANLLAWPIAYILMNMWLESYAFNTTIPVRAFFLAGVLTFLPALIVINFQIFKTASLNPINALKYE